MNWLIHFRYSLRQLFRQPGSASRLLLFVPLSQILPILLMGSAFLSAEQANWFFYTNLAWGFISSCALQALVWLQMVVNSARLDMLLLLDGGVIAWAFGFTAALNAMYITSTAISTLLIGVALHYPLQALQVLVVMLASVPVSIGVICLILGAELRWGRVFHIVNSGLDAVLILAGVMYPLTTLGPILGNAARLLPNAWLNEFLRGGKPAELVIALALAGLFALVGAWWARRCVAAYRTNGVIGVRG
ncbi:hypothetical protein [Actinobaculum sp. 352]|uniref:hypothetical protein n=1 Tax=Actinobaculum sp. 352 TaxID=2490946 RepID=UPI000F7ECDCB|nr:hypothetical protein [Actinobaculum sp. 352]RTE50371.1 hypothetical protein EKN07_04015 [Actinobaculum sp. 352]